MQQMRARCYICVDEHGNYQIAGTSVPTPENKITTLVQYGMLKKRLTTKTFHVDFNIPIPDHEEGIVVNE